MVFCKESHGTDIYWNYDSFLRPVFTDIIDTQEKAQSLLKNKALWQLAHKSKKKPEQLTVSALKKNNICQNQREKNELLKNVDFNRFRTTVFDQIFDGDVTQLSFEAIQNYYQEQLHPLQERVVTLLRENQTFISKHLENLSKVSRDDRKFHMRRERDKQGKSQTGRNFRFCFLFVCDSLALVQAEEIGKTFFGTVLHAEQEKIVRNRSWNPPRRLSMAC